MREYLTIDFSGGKHFATKAFSTKSTSNKRFGCISLNPFNHATKLAVELLIYLNFSSISLNYFINYYMFIQLKSLYIFYNAVNSFCVI
jgi:hypothetical protein